MLAEKQQQNRRETAAAPPTALPTRVMARRGGDQPRPEVATWAATQVVTAMNATHQLGGENYVLWGGREGYESLLNTDLRQEREQIGRFLADGGGAQA